MVKIVQFLQKFQLLLRKSASRTILDCSDLAFSPLHIFSGCLYRAASAFSLFFLWMGADSNRRYMEPAHHSTPELPTLVVSLKVGVFDLCLW